MINFSRSNLSLMSAWGVLVACLAGLYLTGCGYGLGPRPHRLANPLTLSIPVADNKSRYGHLGPDLTKALIAELAGTKGLVIDNAGAKASLKMTITQVVMGSGSWDIVRTNKDDTPEASASREAYVTVDVVFTKPAKEFGAPPISTRSRFSSSRTYLVSQIQGQVEMQEAEALAWIMADLAQKIGLVLFNEF